jgi:hypothetical protein
LSLFIGQILQIGLAYKCVLVGFLFLGAISHTHALCQCITCTRERPILNYNIIYWFVPIVNSLVFNEWPPIVVPWHVCPTSLLCSMLWYCMTHKLYPNMVFFIKKTQTSPLHALTCNGIGNYLIYNGCLWNKN